MRRPIAWLGLVASIVSVGCGRGPGDREQQRARWLLNDEPAGAIGVFDLREALAGGDASQAEVVVVGRVGPDALDQPGGCFVLVDAAALPADHGHADCGEGCPYCAQAARDVDVEGLAYVQFLDPQGRPLAGNCRELFDLSPRQTVVVLGTARLDALGELVLVASGLYVRR